MTNLSHEERKKRRAWAGPRLVNADFVFDPLPGEDDAGGHFFLGRRYFCGHDGFTAKFTISSKRFREIYSLVPLFLIAFFVLILLFIYMLPLFFFFFLFVLVLPIGLALTIFWIWMIVDCLENEPATGSDKIAWLLLIILTHILGAAIYFFVRRLPRQRLPAQPPPAA